MDNFEELRPLILQGLHVLQGIRPVTMNLETPVKAHRRGAESFSWSGIRSMRILSTDDNKTRRICWFGAVTRSPLWLLQPQKQRCRLSLVIGAADVVA